MQAPAAFRIIRTLHDYKKLPIEFLARYVGLSVQEIAVDLSNLERDGAITRDGDTVALTESG